MTRLIALLFALSLAATSHAQTPVTLGEDWTLSNPQPTAEHLNAMTVGFKNRLVIVGEHGSIVTSDDQITWTAQASGIADHLRGVTWTGSQFIAVGDNGKILTSIDAVTWTAATSPGTEPMLAVATSGSQIVAVGGKTSAVTYTSADGITWTRRTVASTGVLKDVLWTGTQFVAIAGSLSLTSADGITWARHTMPCSAPLGLGRLPTGTLVVSGNAVCTSADEGIHWTVRSGPLNLKLSSPGTQVVGVGSDGRIYSTTTGTSWTLVQAAQGFALRASTFINNSYVVAGQAGAIQVGNPLATPTAVALAFQPATRYMVPANGVTWNHSASSPIYVAVGSGATWTSTDGITWVPHQQTGKTMLSVTWTGTCFVAVGSAIWTSTDGITWTQRAAGFSSQAPSFYGVFYFNNKAYVTGYNAKSKAAIIGTSSAPDGYSWNAFTTLTGGNALISIARSASKFVGVGWNGTVGVSTNGTTWSVIRVPLAAGDYFTDVTASAAGTFVATTYDGEIWASTTGTKWSKRFYASHSLWCVTRSANEFLAAGNYGTLVHSFDGLYWREKNLGTHTFINQIALANNQLLAVGGFGAVFRSVGSLPAQPVVNFSQATATVTENGSALPVTITLSSGWALPVSVALSFAGSASTLDYTRSATSLTFAPGETSKSITITPKNDTLKETSESFIISLGSPTGDAIVGSTNTTAITIMDDDSVPPAP